MTDAGIIQSLLDRAGLEPTDRVLEIGPGRGALTIPMARRVERVLAVEKDRDLAAWLQETLPARGIHNTAVVCTDILRLDDELLDALSSSRVLVVGNLPYNISTPVVERLIQHRRRIRRAVLMFQKEVADRLAAPPGGRTYGALTVLVGLHARVHRILRVGKEAFRPRPRVESAVVELDFNAPHPRRPESEAWFERVVKGAFAQRRKTLLNALSSAFPDLPRDELKRILLRCGIDPGRRAESLSIDRFIRLSDALAHGAERPGGPPSCMFPQRR